MNQPEGTARGIESDGRRDADEHFQSWNPTLELFARRHEVVDVAIDLLLAASRKEREHRLVERQPERLACFHFCRHVDGPIEQRMAHERRVDAEPAEKPLLERDDHSGFGLEMSELGNSTRSPGPYLRGHVVEYR